MRKVFLDDLPKRGENSISWNESIGKTVNFIYDDIQGNITIEDYNCKTGFILFRFNDNKEVIKMKYSHFKGCEFKTALKIKTPEFKLKTPTIVKDEKRDLYIFDSWNKKTISEGKERNRKFYKYECNVCKYIGDMEEHHLLKKNGGCSCCIGRIAVLGINTIWDTDRWMCDLGVSEEDAKKYTKGSNENIIATCPDCGEEKKMKINDIYRNTSMGCVCGDGYSFSEKLVYNVLKQLGLNFKFQLSKTTLEWCNKYRYDFYLPEYNMIIETHGEQHYTKPFNNKKLSEEKMNDEAKEKLAISNGIKDYIVIDCRKSNLEWIKNNLINSRLRNIFDLSNIDWINCLLATKRNIIKESCDCWNKKKEEETVTDISNKLGIDRHTLVRYLKKGTQLNWCNYFLYDPKKNQVKKSAEAKFKPIIAYKDSNIILQTNSIKDMIRLFDEKFNIKLNHGYITDVCKGRKSQYKGFQFKYKN